MTNFTAGQRVQADISGTLPILGPGSITPATVVGPGAAPGTYQVQTDVPFNGVNLFQLSPDRLTVDS